MSELVPCPTSRRHCRRDAPCPFCGAALPQIAARSPGAASGRLSRAAIFAGAAFVAPACGSASSHPGPSSTPSNTATDSRASSGRLSGTVTNMRTRLPAPGEAIWIRSAPSEHPPKHPFERSTMTADDGTYTFDDLPPGEYVVVFPSMRRRNDDDDDRGTRVTIKRGEAAVLDQAIVVYDPSDAKMPYGAPPVRRRVV
jgi:hypothetical protein